MSIEKIDSDTVRAMESSDEYPFEDTLIMNMIMLWVCTCVHVCVCVGGGGISKW